MQGYDLLLASLCDSILKFRFSNIMQRVRVSVTIFNYPTHIDDVARITTFPQLPPHQHVEERMKITTLQPERMLRKQIQLRVLSI